MGAEAYTEQVGPPTYPAPTDLISHLPIHCSSRVLTATNLLYDNGGHDE